MSSAVYVLGGWQSDFAAKAGEGGFGGLLAGAVEGALDDARLDPADIEVAHVGNLAGELFCGQAHLGAMLASVDPALAGIPTARHEAACASGSVAALAAMSELEAGRYDVALVAGAEVMRNVPGQKAAELLGCAGWVGREMVGEEFPWPSQFAQVAEIYDQRWGLSHEHLARIAEVNFANARANPNAQTRDWVPPAGFGEDDDLNPVIRGPLRKQDCGRITDGSAAIVLASASYADAWAREHSVPLDTLPVLAGWGHHTAPLRLDDKLDPNGEGLLFPHLRETFSDALSRAGLDDVSDLDAIEVHDCFTISEYVAIDHLGITPPGESWRAIEDGTPEMGGALPINPSGGLLGLGHPVGATGVRMLLDATKQVRGLAGDYQVPGARRVATSNIGGSFTTAVSFVVSAA
jgi:acetyl-CoA C-acetyltransferase